MNGKSGYPSTERQKRPRDATPPRRSDSRSRSRSRSRERGGGSYHHGGDRYSREDTRESNPGTVFVGNISHDTTENTLRDFFETYGRVASAKVRRAGTPRAWRQAGLQHTGAPCWPEQRPGAAQCVRRCGLSGQLLRSVTAAHAWHGFAARSVDRDQNSIRATRTLQEGGVGARLDG